MNLDIVCLFAGADADQEPYQPTRKWQMSYVNT